MKKCFTLFAALMLLGSISVAENKNILPLPSLQRSTDTGYIGPDVDNTIDLGTSSIEFRSAYFDGTVKTDVLVVDENATIAQFLGSTPITVLATANTSIPVTGTFCSLISTGAFTNTGTPDISVSTASVGDYLVLTTTQTNAITVTEGDSQGLRLGANTRAIGQYDSLFLVLHSSGTNDSQKWWQEISFIEN